MGFTDVLKKAFPFLTIAAQMVPGGNIATTALGQILNLKPGSSLNDAGAALINATPEQRAALLAEENRHEEAMKAMGINSAEEFAKITNADRDSARNREVNSKDSWTPRVLAAVICIMGLYVVYEIFHGRTEVLKDSTISLTVGTVIGYVFREIAEVYSYYFGNSAGTDLAQPEVTKK